MTPSPIDRRSTDEDRDRRLAELLAGSSPTTQRAGREPDLDAAARLHPDLGRRASRALGRRDHRRGAGRVLTSDETGHWPPMPVPRNR